MKLSDIMSHAGLAIYAEWALVLFMLTFIAIAIWTFRPASKARFESDAQMPLDDEHPQAPMPARGR